MSNVLVLNYQLFNTRVPREKCPVDIVRVILLARHLDHVFWSMNLETFHSGENRQRVWCEKGLHLAGKQHYVIHLLSLWAQVKVQSLISIDSSAWFTIKVIGPFQYCRTKHIRPLLFCGVIHVVESLLCVPCPKSRVFGVFKNPDIWKTYSS